MSLGIQRNTRGQRDLFELSAALVVIQKFIHGIIGNEKIDPPVAIVIRDCDAEPLARFGQTQFLRDLGKVAAAVIVVNQRRNGTKGIRMAVSAVSFYMLAAPDIVEIPIHVAQNNQVEKPIVIKVYPGGAR